MKLAKHVVPPSLIVCAALASTFCTMTLAQPVSRTFKPSIPKTWDEKALADWATPVAGLNVRPSHVSEEEYYKAPISNYKTYPVYYPGREPAGYWEFLQKVGPKPILDPAKLTTQQAWVEAGRDVFEQWDLITMRNHDPKVVALFRSVQELEKVGARTATDGTFRDIRWVPTEKGVALGLTSCAGCHTRYEPDGRRINGPRRGSPVVLSGSSAG